MLQSFPVRFYMDNGVPARTNAYREASRLVEQLGITYLDATARTITLGDAKLTILGLPLERDPTDQNNTSVGVVVEYGTFKALLTGDSQVAELMAGRVLEKTPEADLGISVTGHLGPDAPPQLDGHVYVALAWRRELTQVPSARLLQCRRSDSRSSAHTWAPPVAARASSSVPSKR